MRATRQNERRDPAWTHVVLLVVATFVAFGPALGAEFTNWDDRENFVENAAYRGLTAEHLRWMFTTTHMGPYQPLSWLTLAIDHAIGGLDATVYHRTNLVLHACGAIALYAFARRVFDDLGRGTRFLTDARTRAFAAFGAALLFAVHPLRVESVAWVTERRDVLSAPFYFLFLLAWWRYARGGGARDYGFALAALVLSLLAKASAIVAPVLLVVLDLGPLREEARARGLRRCVLEKLPVLAIVIPVAWIAAVGQARDSTMLGTELHGPTTRAIQALYSAWFYASRTLWPAGLQPMHRLPSMASFFQAELLVPAAIALVATGVALFAWRRRSPAAWAWCAYLVVLAPVSGLAQSGGHLVADRYSYLSCVPFALLAAAGLAWIARHGRELAWGALLVVAGLLAWRSNGLTRTWHDSWTLWRSTLDVDPLNDTALVNLAVLELETAQTLPDAARAREMLLQANAHASRAVELNPDPRRLYNLAATCVKLADYDPDRAKEHIENAARFADQARARAKELGLRIEPRWSVIHAFACFYAERWEDAVAAARDALAGRPDDRDVRRLEADSLVKLGRAHEAVLHMQETVELAPDDTLVWLALSLARRADGDVPGARAAANEGLQRAERVYGAHAKELRWYDALVRASRP